MTQGDVKRQVPFGKIALAVVFVIAALSPLAQLLRTQNPWNCFMLTSDESYFVQAIHNWIGGDGFRPHGDAAPFGPGLTVGVPMAWGTWLMRKVAPDMSLAQAARLWVHFCFYVFLAVIAGVSSRRGKGGIAAVVSLGLIGWIMTVLPSGPYLTYGVLGEVPGALVGLLALLALDRGRLELAGVLSAACFIVKPSFVFFVPSLALASLLTHRWRGLRVGAAAGVVLAAYWAYVAHARGQALPEYFREYAQIASAISLHNAGASLLDFYREAGMGVTLVSLGIIAHAGLLRKRAFPSEWAAWVLFLVGTGFYLAMGRKPVAKQFFVFLILPAAVLTIRAGMALAPRLSKYLSASVVQVVAMAVIATWLVNIPPTSRRRFMQTPENACPLKEQRYVDARLAALQRDGKLLRSDVAAVVTGQPSILFLYELGWEPPYRYSLAELGAKPPLWIVGETQALSPAPKGCKPEWMGGQYGLLKCQ